MSLPRCSDTTGAPEPGLVSSESDTRQQSALAILGAWQLAAHRGWAVAQRRLDRHIVVQTLLAKLNAEGVPVEVILLVADDAARQKWLRALVSDPDAPASWNVRTSSELFTDAESNDSESVVVADELEVYLTGELGALLTRARAVLALCGSPAGFRSQPHLRSQVGRLLDTTIRAPFEASLLTTVRVQETTLAGNTDQAEEWGDELAGTTPDPAILSLYLTEIQKFRLLTSNEEIDLSKAIEAGLYAETLLISERLKKAESLRSTKSQLISIARDGATAKKRFIQSNLRLVYSIARRYSTRIEIMDAIQEGNLGLIRAVEKFDYKQGNKFSTYATWWIRQGITRAIADQTRLIRIPVHLFETDNPVLAELRLRERSFEDKSAGAIAAATNIDIKTVESALIRHSPPFGLEVMAEHGIDLIDVEDPESFEYLVRKFLKNQIQNVLETLSEREADVLRLRFGLVDDICYTLDEIGRTYGVTRERVRQIQNLTLLRLRHPRYTEVLIDYFEGIVNPELIAKYV